MATVDGLAAKCTEHCTIGRDERRIRSQTQAFEQRSRVSRAAPRSDSHRDARCLRGTKRLRVALADFLRSAGSSVPSMSIATRRTGGCIAQFTGSE